MVTLLGFFINALLKRWLVSMQQRYNFGVSVNCFITTCTLYVVYVLLCGNILRKHIKSDKSIIFIWQTYLKMHASVF